VLFFIEIGRRRVHVTVSTSNPDSVFVAQQARNLAMSLTDEGAGTRFLIRDRDAKFSRSFDDVLASEGIQVICTPIRAPNANAFAQALGRDAARRVPGLDVDLRRPAP
jgi:putative transposase